VAARAAIAAVLIAQVLLGARYAVRTPLWQAPDEPAHFNYARQMLEHGYAPPRIEPGDYPHERLEGLKAAGFPPGSDVSGIDYEDHQPPAYYALAGIPLALARLSAGAEAGVAAGGGAGDSLKARVLGIRLTGVLLGTLAAALTWAAARAAWPGDRGGAVLAVAAAGFAGFLPMHLAMVASVNNDALAAVVVPALLWLSLRRAAGRGRARPFAALAGALAGLTLLTKLTAYPAVLLPALAELLRADPSRSRRARARAAVLPVFLGVAIAAPWFVRNMLVYGIADPFGLSAHNAAVTGQPRTVDWIAEHGLTAYAERTVGFTFKSFYGVFGWLGVFLDARIYAALAAVTVVAALGFLPVAVATIGRARAAGAAAGGGKRARPQARAATGGGAGPGLEAGGAGVEHWLRRRRWARARARGLALGGYLVLTAAAGYGWYNLTYIQHQGRYLFPALAPLALWFALGTREVACRACRVARVGDAAARRLEVVALAMIPPAMACLAWLALERYVVPALAAVAR